MKRKWLLLLSRMRDPRPATPRSVTYFALAPHGSYRNCYIRLSWARPKVDHDQVIAKNVGNISVLGEHGGRRPKLH